MVYVMSMVMFRTTLSVSYIFAPEIFLKVFIVTVISWIPFWIFNYVYTGMYPEVHSKI